MNDDGAAVPGDVLIADVGLDAYGHRPFWRGRVHLGAALVAVPAAVLLILAARSTAGRVAASIYAASLIGVFAVSASYHRLARTPTAVKWMRRADHSMIFVLIAGTYTPICLLVLPPRWGIPLLVVVWAVAFGGIVMKMSRLGNGPGSSGSWLYMVLGWAAIVATPVLIANLTATQVALMAVGGILYTGGTFVLARRWPDPLPHSFGYHEIWHSITVAAGACHFALIAAIVVR